MDITISLSEAQVRALETLRMQSRGPNMLPTSPNLQSFLAERISSTIVLPAMQQIQSPAIVAARVKLDAAQMEYTIAQNQESQVEVAVVK